MNTHPEGTIVEDKKTGQRYIKHEGQYKPIESDAPRILVENPDADRRAEYVGEYRFDKPYQTFSQALGNLPERFSANTKSAVAGLYQAMAGDAVEQKKDLAQRDQNLGDILAGRHYTDEEKARYGEKAQSVDKAMRSAWEYIKYAPDQLRSWAYDSMEALAPGIMESTLRTGQDMSAEAAQERQQYASDINPNNTGRQLFLDVTDAVSDMAPPIALGTFATIVTKNPALGTNIAMSGLLATTYGRNYNDVIEKSSSPEMANAHAMVKTALEFLPVMKFGKFGGKALEEMAAASRQSLAQKAMSKLPKRMSEPVENMVKGEIGKAFINEGLQEGQSSIANDLYDVLTGLSEGITIGELLSNAGYSALVGGLAGGTTAAGAKVADGVAGAIGRKLNPEPNRTPEQMAIAELLGREPAELDKFFKGWDGKKGSLPAGLLDMAGDSPAKTDALGRKMTPIGGATQPYLGGDPLSGRQDIDYARGTQPATGPFTPGGLERRLGINGAAPATTASGTKPLFGDKGVVVAGANKPRVGGELDMTAAGFGADTDMIPAVRGDAQQGASFTYPTRQRPGDRVQPDTITGQMEVEAPGYGLGITRPTAAPQTSIPYSPDAEGPYGQQVATPNSLPVDMSSPMQVGAAQPTGVSAEFGGLPVPENVGPVPGSAGTSMRTVQTPQPMALPNLPPSITSKPVPVDPAGNAAVPDAQEPDFSGYILDGDAPFTNLNKAKKAVKESLEELEIVEVPGRPGKSGKETTAWILRRKYPISKKGFQPEVVLTKKGVGFKSAAAAKAGLKLNKKDPLDYDIVRRGENDYAAVQRVPAFDAGNAPVGQPTYTGDPRNDQIPRGAAPTIPAQSRAQPAAPAAKSAAPVQPPAAAAQQPVETVPEQPTQPVVQQAPEPAPVQAAQEPVAQEPAPVAEPASAPVAEPVSPEPDPALDTAKPDGGVKERALTNEDIKEAFKPGTKIESYDSILDSFAKQNGIDLDTVEYVVESVEDDGKHKIRVTGKDKNGKTKSIVGSIDSFRLFFENETGSLKPATGKSMISNGTTANKIDGVVLGGSLKAGKLKPLGDMISRMLKAVGIDTGVAIFTDVDTTIGDLESDVFVNNSVVGNVNAVKSSSNTAGRNNTGAQVDGGEVKVAHSIALKTRGMSALLMVETASHEIGHLIQSKLFLEQSADVRAAVFAEYMKWLKASKKLSDKELSAISASVEAAYNAETAGEFPVLPRDYLESFAEYFADQVNKWAMERNLVPKTKSDKFFSEVAKKLAEMFKVLTGKHPSRARPEFKKMMDGIVMKANQDPELVAKAMANIGEGNAPAVKPVAEKTTAVAKEEGKVNTSLSGKGKVSAEDGSYRFAIENADPSDIQLLNELMDDSLFPGEISKDGKSIVFEFSKEEMDAHGKEFASDFTKALKEAKAQIKAEKKSPDEHRIGEESKDGAASSARDARRQAATAAVAMANGDPAGVDAFFDGLLKNSEAIAKLGDKAASATGKVGRYMMNHMTVTMMRQRYGKMFTVNGRALIDLFNNHRMERDARINRGSQQIKNNIAHWLNLKDKQDMADFQLDATTAQVHPDQAFVARLDIDEAEKNIEKWKASREKKVAKGGDPKWYDRRILAERNRIKEEKQRMADHKRLSALYKKKIKEDPEFERVYKATRDHYTSLINEYFDALTKRIEDMISDPQIRNEAISRVNKYRENIMHQAESAPYFPLMRFGDIVITGTGPDGQPYRYHFEKDGDAKAMKRELIAKGYDPAQMNGPRKMIAKEYDSIGVDNKFARDVFSVLEKEGVMDDNIREQISSLLIRALPELSYSKKLLKRKNVEGFSRDAYRAYLHSMMHGQRAIANIYHNHKMDGILREMGEHVDAGTIKDPKAGAVVNSLKEIHKRNQEPGASMFTEIVGNLGFTYYLAGLSGGIVNPCQTWMVGSAALVSEFGSEENVAVALGSAFKELGVASIEFASGIPGSLRDMKKMMAIKYKKAVGKEVKGEEIDDVRENLLDQIVDLSSAKNKNGEFILKEEWLRNAIAQLISEGTIDMTQVRDIAMQSSISSIDGTRSKAARLMEAVSKAMAFAFHNSEVYNRQATAVAALRMAHKRGDSHEKAIATTKRIILELSHYDMSQSNRPIHWRSGLMRAIMMFKQYQLNQVFQYGHNLSIALPGFKAWKEATPEERKAARRMIGTMASLQLGAVGVIGLPGVAIPFFIADMLLSAFGDDDDPEDAKTLFRNSVEDLLGEGPMSQMFLYGLGGGIEGGPDFHSRLSMASLFINLHRPDMDAVEIAVHYSKEIGGPMARLALEAIPGGFDAFREDPDSIYSPGPWLKFIEKATPKMFADMAKAYRMWNDGERIKTGEVLIENYTLAEVLMQGVGFTPSRKREAYEKRRVVQSLDKRVSEQRSQILRELVGAIEDKDQFRLMDALKKARKFGMTNPTSPITMDDVRARISNQLKRKLESQYGYYLSPNRRYLYDKVD